jgi:ATP-dependent DNA ligase
MLATRGVEPFSDPGWIFERALGGVRCIALGDANGVRLRSDDNKDISRSFPSIVEALSHQPTTTFALDGEIVAAGLKSGRRVPDRLYLYDVVQIDGYDVSRLELGDRKRLLRMSFSFGGPVRYSRYRNGAGEDLFAEACKSGWAGVIAKKRSAPYHQSPSKFWLEFPCPR